MLLTCAERVHLGLQLREWRAAGSITTDHLGLLNLAKNELHEQLKGPLKCDQNSHPELPMHLNSRAGPLHAPPALLT